MKRSVSGNVCKQKFRHTLPESWLVIIVLLFYGYKVLYFVSFVLWIICFYVFAFYTTSMKLLWTHVCLFILFYFIRVFNLNNIRQCYGKGIRWLFRGWKACNIQKGGGVLKIIVICLKLFYVVNTRRSLTIKSWKNINLFKATHLWVKWTV